MVAVPTELAVAAPVEESIDNTALSELDHVPPELVCVIVGVSFKQTLGEFKIVGPACMILFVEPFIVIEVGVK